MYGTFNRVYRVELTDRSQLYYKLLFSERGYILLYTTVLLQEHCSQIYYDCQLNSDGSSWKTTQLRCDANLYFDPDTLSCTQPNNIEDCQDLSTTLHWRTTYVKWSNKKKILSKNIF